MNQQQLNASHDGDSGKLLAGERDKAIKNYLTDQGVYITETPPEALKSLFHLVAGRPESIKKSLKGDIVVTPEDLAELNYAVQKKLEHFELVGEAIAVTIAYSDNTSHEFGTWDEFITADWSSSNETKSITVKWDFLAKLPNYLIPQRHTATVQMLDYEGIQSFDDDDFFPYVRYKKTVTCKIDFINPLLGNEFLNIVEKWHKARTKSFVDVGLLGFLKKRRKLVANSVGYLIFTMVTLLACALLHFFLKSIGLNEYLKIQHAELIVFWTVGTIILLFLTGIVVTYLHESLRDSLNDINNSTMFNLTRGDGNKRERIEKENAANKLKVIWNLILSIAIKIVAGSVATFLLTLKGI